MAAILFILQKVLFLGFPLPFDILKIFSSVASFHIGVLTLLCEEKMPPDVILGESSGGKNPQVSPQGLPTGYPDCTKGAWPASDDVHVEGLLHSPGQERHAEWLMWARIGVWIVISLAILKQYSVPLWLKAATLVQARLC